MNELLNHLNAENNGLIDQAREWIAEGWRLKGDPTPEQIAAALLMEANTQDKCVKHGESDESFPHHLRNVAFKILDAGHARSTLTDHAAVVILWERQAGPGEDMEVMEANHRRHPQTHPDPNIDLAGAILQQLRAELQGGIDETGINGFFDIRSVTLPPRP